MNTNSTSNDALNDAALTYSMPTPSVTELREALPLSSYERKALKRIGEVKNPKPNWTSQLANKLHQPFEIGGDVLFDTPVGEKAGVALANVLSLLQRGATWSVRERAILDDFDGAASSFAAIGDLPLKTVDDAAKGLERKYRLAATVEGTLVGSVGAVGMAVDIPLILSLALRGTTEVAAYYGFYPFDAAERAYALDLISTASAPTLQKRQENLVSLDAHSSNIESAQRHEIGAVFMLQVVERVVEAIAARMAQGKVAQTVPVVGALIGGGFNRWFISQVMTLSAAMYRERFLMRQHGPAVVTFPKPFSELA